MNIWFDSSPLLGESGGRGIGTYTRELLRGLRELHDLPESLIVQAAHEIGKGEAASEHFDLVHYPYFDLFFTSLPKEFTMPTVVTVHDAIPLVYPDEYPAGLKGKVKFWKQRSRLQKADIILTDSEVSKQDIVAHLQVPESQIRVVYLAASPEIQPVSEKIQEEAKKELKLPAHYILYVGDINYNKNLPLLLAVFSQLPKTLHLCVVSKTFTNTNIPEGQQIARALDENEIRERVHVLDIPKDRPDLLSATMQQAECLIQPSLYEGFGLPVLEAMQAGTVVVSTNGGSLPEVVGEAAIVCDPTFVGLQDALNEALHLTEAERKEYIKRGQHNARRFSWEKTAQQTYEAYREARENWKLKQK